MILTLNNCRFEVLRRGDQFLGLGRIWVNDVLVRSGRLPLSPATQTFRDGLELVALEWREPLVHTEEIRLRCTARFAPLAVKLMRDHSFDPIHATGDWDQLVPAGEGLLELVLRPARDEFNGIAFSGFSYHWEHSSETVPLFYLLDRASWELDGDIEGATVYSQSACSDPVVKFGPETAWTTEGQLFFLVEAGSQNPVMTHNLPRWASHGSFDFQFKDGRTLIGVFERVELIRSLLKREAGKPELKCFDKYIFDQSSRISTSPKHILLNCESRTEVGQRNLWTWIHCEVEARARREFGLMEEPLYPRLCVNYWNDFSTESYLQDLLPAARALGFREVFVDNLKKSAMTARAPLSGTFHWNMCCGHEYEIAPELGGNEGVRRLVDEFAAHGIRVMSWTNNDQALSSPLNASEHDQHGWYVLLEDSRQKYGGAYAGVMSVLDLSVREAREYFVRAHQEIRAETGLSGYLFDSFYNLGFMPVSYRHLAPRTMWRGLLQAVKELQDAGVHFLIESFGPFGTPQHGHPASYNFDSIFICYRVGLGNGYSTIPTGNPLYTGHPEDAQALYYTLAHMAGGAVELFKDGIRRDQIWGAGHRQALRDYHECLPWLKVRYLQEDGAGVLWHDAERKRGTLFNFAPRRLELPGKVQNVTTGEWLAPSAEYHLEARLTYVITETELPVKIGI